jgi:hypothetical protein
MRFQTLTLMSGTVPNVRRERVHLYPIVAISLHNAQCSIWTGLLGHAFLIPAKESLRSHL